MLVAEKSPFTVMLLLKILDLGAVVPSEVHSRLRKLKVPVPVIFWVASKAFNLTVWSLLKVLPAELAKFPDTETLNPRKLAVIFPLMLKLPNTVRSPSMVFVLLEIVRFE